jgi:transcriptional regulator with XRE-family HTH domain
MTVKPPKKSSAAHSFSERLRELMRQRGMHAPGVSRSGVDVGKLAAAAGISYEMARRYVDGQSMPRSDKMAAIARWLGVSSDFLAFGSETAAKPIDEGTLQACIEALIAAQGRAGRSLSTEDQARIVAALYAEALQGRQPEVVSLDLILKVTK